jgi:hypothetical protein
MLINRTGGGGENVKEEVNVQTPLIEQIAQLVGLTPRGGARYLWAKFDSTGETFIELVTSPNPDTHADGLADDGYYYQQIVYVVGADDKGTYLLEL